MLNLRAIPITFVGNRKVLVEQARSAIFQMKLDRTQSVIEIDSGRLNIECRINGN